jgi:hypothetical protein
MEFREAAQLLGEQITTAQMAEALGVSEASVRQARLIEGAAGYRRPPEGWQKALAKMARERGKELERLAAQLEGRARPA